jgi:L-alanine-DL-glutamate epimerase-like enolase superfamily enzyme
MKESVITRIDVFKLDIERRVEFRISLGVMDAVQNLLIRIHTEDGLFGWGEGAPLPYLCGETQAIAFEAAKDLAGFLIGKNPYALEARIREMDRFLVHNTTTKSTFDMALYDLLSKRAGLPLYALLGGEKRLFFTDETIGIDDPQTMAREALAAKERGFPAIKVKLGTNRADDVARIEAIRAAIGDVVLLRIDANQGWDLVTAKQTLQDLARFDIQYCEEPVAHWNNAALRYLRERSPIPIMADESLFDHHDAFRLASMGACDYFNIKLSKSGGIHTALRINAIAEGAGIQCMMGCMAETRLGLTAAAHLVSARPNIAFADLDSAFNKERDVVCGGITYDGGWILLPDAPGHGADIKPEALESMEVWTITA